MPSKLHEALLLLFRNRPSLAPELLRDALHFELPAYTDVRIDAAELTDIQPAEYRADLVVLLLNGEPVLGIIVEAQLSTDERKRYVWPVYTVNLRARLKCPVCLLVVTADDATARWAAKAVDLGGGNRFVPLVLRPSGVPEVTDEDEARADPELAVLSAMAHGKDRDTDRAVKIAVAAQVAALGLDPDRSRLYFDLVLTSLSEAGRRELQTMDPAKYEYQSDFAKRYVAQGRTEGRSEGRAEGLIEGRAALIAQLLEARFGSLSEKVKSRLGTAQIDELDAIGKRLLNAKTLEEAMG